MTSLKRRGLLALGTLATGTLAAPTLLRAQSLTNIADTMAGDARFSRFLDLITRTTMVEDFRQAGPMTVFAPVDAAFSGAPAGLLQDLTGRNEPGANRNDVERQRLGALINYHIVPGAFQPEQISGSDRRLRTRNGADIQISGTGGNLTLQNPAPAQQLGGFGAAGAQMAAQPAQVLGSPIVASNGVIYPISQVLWP